MDKSFRIQSPREMVGCLQSASESAQATHEPVLLRGAWFADERGWSLMNQLRGVLSPEGQINFSMQHPGVIKAWHRHAHQADFWICLTGHLKVGVYCESDRAAWQVTIGERAPSVVIIPPGLWHGAATVGTTPAGLLYYVTRAYDPSNPDEQRRPFDSVPGFSWDVRHG